MIIKGNNGKASARKRQPKSASSSKSKRSNLVPTKNPVFADNGKAVDELDGNIVCTEGATLQNEASAVVLEETGIAKGALGDDLPNNPTELTAITIHQPWASLIAEGKKHYETRDRATDYRGQIAIHAGKKFQKDESLISLLEIPATEIPLGAVVAIAQLTDCILMDEEFILKQSSFEQYLGLWEVGRYAWKLENVRAIEPIAVTGKQGLWKWQTDSEKIKSNDDEKLGESQTTSLRKHFWELVCIHRDASSITDAFKNPKSDRPSDKDCGELHHVAEDSGQLNLLEWVETEPPDPDDFPGDLEGFKAAYLAWESNLTDTAEEEYQHTTPEEICQSNNGNGSICAQELAQDSPTQGLNCGENNQTGSAITTNSAKQFCAEDSPTQSDLSTLNQSILPKTLGGATSSQLPHPASHSHLTENEAEALTNETVSPQSLMQSTNCSQNLHLLKTSPDCSRVQSNPEAITSTLKNFSNAFPATGTMRNGLLLAAPILPPPGVENDSLLLRSPGGLSSAEGTRPPGKSRLENQLNQLGLIQDGEVAAPEFLEAGYNLPLGWTNPKEQRTALELAQVQAQQSSIDHKSELPAETATTAIEGKPLEMPLTGESPLSDSSESSISIALPANIGALSKDQLLLSAIEQHKLINIIERKEFELGIKKLHRVRVTGLYLQEFKKRCRHGEFESELESCGIKPRRAQQYMLIARNWEVIEAEAKAQTVAFLVEENQSFGIKWALDVMSQKKSLKSAAPPADPDCWRTPNTAEQPIIDLVKQALGGQIWCDPCADAGHRIPAAVHYNRSDNGLSPSNIWKKTVFCNPPFFASLPWVEKACLSIARGECSAAILLLKAGCIGNQGTGALINKYASAICHWRGRIAFLNEEGKAIKGADFDCVFVYLGDRLDLFKEVFEPWGTIATIVNHFSSINKKYLNADKPAFPDKPDFNSIRKEEKQLATTVGLGNGRSGVLPDMRDRDRELSEKYDPHTVVDVLSVPPSMPTPAATPLSDNLKAKENCLNDYITAISSNLSDFSNQQIAFLAEIINEESAKRIGF